MWMLQVKEVALIHSEGILAGEMKHGPLALVDETLPIMVVATQDRMYGKMQSVILQLLARQARLIILCNQGDDHIRKICKAHRGCRIIEARLAPDSNDRVMQVPVCFAGCRITDLMKPDWPPSLLTREMCRCPRWWTAYSRL